MLWTINKKIINSYVKSTVSSRRGMGGGFLHKNIRVEENAGLRENSYLTWFLLFLLACLYNYYYFMKGFQWIQYFNNYGLFNYSWRIILFGICCRNGL